MKKKSEINISATLSWILYDLANTIYSMNIVTMYFPTWIMIDLALSDFYVSFANSFSMILVALTLPILGEISDRYHKKMPFLITFTLICISFTAFIGVAGYALNDIAIKVSVAILFYTIANYAYQGGLVFYNALLPNVCSKRSIGRVSGYGVAIGYFGSIIGLTLVLPLVEGTLFGINLPLIEKGGSIASFIPSAALFLIFAIPAFLFIKEQPHVDPPKKFQLDIKTSFRKIWDGISNTRKYPGVTRFLVAKFFYEDAIQTVILFMAIYAQKVMGFSKTDTTTFFIAVIPSAIVGSTIFGIVTDHLGPKKTLSLVLIGWIASLILLICTKNILTFWIIGALVGIFMGSTWTSARPLLISLVPQNMLGEFFGLYSLSGKLAAIAGPIVWAIVVYVFDSYGVVFKYKAAIGALTIMIIIGLVILQKVPNFRQRVVNDSVLDA
ncbi:MFS transporter [candidate division KSB1 bacterium]|nr:MFS transporter [candidate division KSB1 bacterium]